MAKMAKMARTLFEFNGNFAKYMFNVGAPDEPFLKKVAKMMKIATEKRLTAELESGVHLMQYGAPSGDPQFIRALCTFLTRQYADTVDMNNLVQTCGASSGLFYILTQMFPKKCTIYCEEFTYHIALSTMRKLAFPLESIPLQSDGINCEILAQKLQNTMKTGRKMTNEDHDYSAVLFLIPHYQNPTGIALSPEKCETLVKLAREYNLLIFCDDVYNLLYYEGQKPLKRLVSYDKITDCDYRGGNVISNGTFSKLLSPGLRLGWMELPAGIKDKFWDHSPIIDSSGGISNYVGGIVAVALENGLVDEILADTREELAQRLQILLTALESDDFKDCQLYCKPVGGYFLFLKIPSQINVVELHRILDEKYSLRFVQGSHFYSGETKKPVLCQYLRISWSHVSRKKISEGIELLGKTIREMSQN